MSLRVLISKFALSTILVLSGLIVLIMAMSQGQNSNVLLGAGVLVVAGIISALYAMEIITKSTQSILFWVVLVIAIGTAYLNYRVIEDKLEFDKMAEARREVVIERLMNIREAQKAYKDEKGKYAKSFEELKNFVTYDSLTEIFAEGVVPDTIATEYEAWKLGIITRDTIRKPVMDKIFPNGINMDSLAYIPFGDGAKFKIDAGMVERSGSTVPVFEVFGAYKYIYKGLNTSEYNIDLEDGLKVGSMQDPSTSGNWE